MQICITAAVVILLIVGDIIYVRWALNEYNPTESANTEAANRIIEEAGASHSFAIGANLGVMGVILLLWEFEVGFLFLIIATVMMQFSK